MDQQTRLEVIRELFEEGGTVDPLTVMNVLNTDTETLSEDFKTLIQEGYIVKVRAGQYRRKFDVEKYLSQALYEREKKTYNPDFLEEYTPNETFLLEKEDLEKREQHPESMSYSFWENMNEVETFFLETVYMLASIEGTEYSKWETEVFIKYGLIPKGMMYTETQKLWAIRQAVFHIITHSSDIDFMFKDFEDIHRILWKGRADDYILGKLRTFEQIIPDTTYLPITDEVHLELQMWVFLEKVRTIHNPYEQSFFLLVFISYLQPFSVANMELARIMSLIPLIQNQLAPLSWKYLEDGEFDVSMRGVYELCDVSLLQEIYMHKLIWGRTWD